LEEAQFKIINKSGIELRTKNYPSKYNYASAVESGSGTEKHIPTKMFLLLKMLCCYRIR
jgi:hypothetical protein